MIVNSFILSSSLLALFSVLLNALDFLKDKLQSIIEVYISLIRFRTTFDISFVLQVNKFIVKGSTKTSMHCRKSATCSKQLLEYLTVRNS